MIKINKKYLFVFAFSLFLIGLVYAASGAPTGITFHNNATNNYDEGSFFVNWTAGAGDAVSNYSIYVFSNNTFYLKATNDSVTGYSFSNTTEANYTFVIGAVNATGVETNSTGNLSMYVDSSGPTIALDNYTNLTLKKNTDNLTLNISVVDSLSGLTGSECLVDVNGTNQSIAVSNGWCNSTGIKLTGLADGNHSIKVYANDSVGNWALNDSYYVKMDSTAPTLSLSLSGATETSITLGVSTNGVSCTSNRGSVSTTSLADTGLSCGTSYAYSVTCVDNASNSVTKSASYSTSSCPSGSGLPFGTYWVGTYVSHPYEMQAGLTRTLSPMNRIEFTLGNNIHHVGVVNVTSNTAVVNVSSDSQQKVMSVGESAKFNLNGDGYYDLLVTLNSINSGAANVTVKSIHEAVNPSVTQPTNGATQPTTSVTTNETNVTTTATPAKKKSGWIWVLLVIVVLGIVLYYFRDKFFSKPSKREKKF